MRVVLLFAALGLLAGCSESTKQSIQEGLNKVVDSTNDAAITVAVKAKLVDDEETKAGKISVDTSGGVVTLKGTQPTREAKERAEAIAKKQDGVVRVENQITVEPGPSR